MPADDGPLIDGLRRDLRQEDGPPRSTRAWDVAVVGAGPAGSTLAAHLASRGRHVLLLDRDRFPREKVCGDGLIPDALAALGRLGLAEEVAAAGYRSTRVTIWSPSRLAVDIPGTFVTLKRLVLDALIARAAVRRGAAFTHGRVVALDCREPGEVRLRLAGLESPVHARVAVVATGADQSLCLPRPGLATDSGPTGIALRRYVRSRARIDGLQVSFDRRVLPGYAWIFPLGDGEYNIGCGTFPRDRTAQRVDLRRTFERFTSGFPPAAGLMAQSEWVAPLRGGRLRCSLAWLPLAANDRVVAIGETIGATFPFTGEGIGKAMETAEIAAELIDEALDRDCPAELRRLGQEVHRRLKPRYEGYERAEAWMSRPWTADLLAWLARWRPGVRSAAAGILDETVDPRAVFSWRGLAATLLR